ncbi:hypothetical protein LCGC14_1269390 [marine sediment metagenome]|uniref:DNA methylase N-4/N-6 domain-containing protein n=1 Tax=marine sediment metagenome TaxID=412755 RepID=A0A0F9P1N9_9ZZZZ
MKPYYEADGVTIYHGDAIDVSCALDNATVDVVFTDPPYSSGARNAAQMRSRGSMRRADGKYGRDRWIGSDNLTSHGFQMLVRLLAVECLRLTVKDGHYFSFIDWRQYPVLAGMTESAGWTIRSLLVWDKGSYGMGNGFRQQAEFCLHASHGVADNFLRHDIGTVITLPRPKADIHPTQKPEAFVEIALSAVPGDRVFDPFMGSGTTLIAARALGRRAIGADNREEYCEIAARRLAQTDLFTGPGRTAPQPETFDQEAV